MVEMFFVSKYSLYRNGEFVFLGNEYHDAIMHQCVRQTCLQLTAVINKELKRAILQALSILPPENGQGNGSS